MSSADAPVFEALIVPHRSLTRIGRTTVVGSLAVLTAAIACRFWLLGAWPVVAFCLLEAPLVGGLLWISQRRARASELIMLTAQEIRVIRTDAAGRRQEITLPSAWLRVDLHADRGTPRLLLSSHGRGCEVAAFLHEADKKSLFKGLSDALHRLRNPRFENPQLR